MSNLDAKFDIEREYGTFGSWDTNTKEINLVSWNNKYPSYDIRTWYPDDSMPYGKRPGRGITLTVREIIKLYEILSDNIDEFRNKEADNERRRAELREKRDREYQYQKDQRGDNSKSSSSKRNNPEGYSPQGPRPTGRTKNGIPRDDSLLGKKPFGRGNYSAPDMPSASSSFASSNDNPFSDDEDDE